MFKTLQMVKTLLNFTKRLCIILGEVTMEDTDWNGIINKLKLSAGPHTPRERREGGKGNCFVDVWAASNSKYYTILERYWQAFYTSSVSLT